MTGFGWAQEQGCGGHKCFCTVVVFYDTTSGMTLGMIYYLQLLCSLCYVLQKYLDCPEL